MKRTIGLLAGAVVVAAAAAHAESPPCFAIYDTAQPGVAFGFAASVTRSGGSPLPLQDYTVGALFSTKNGAGVHQWAFGAATEAWALPGSHSILVAFESAVINQEPANPYPKVANNVVMKNRGDGAADPGQPMNANSIAYWITAQPGTGFERGLVFGTGALAMQGGRAAAIDLSDIPDALIGEIDLVRIRKDVSLRYDPATRQLVLHVAPSGGP